MSVDTIIALKVLTNMFLLLLFYNYKVRPLSICTWSERFWTMVHPDRSTQEDSRRSFVQARLREFEAGWHSDGQEWGLWLQTIDQDPSDENNSHDIPSILDRENLPIRYRVTEWRPWTRESRLQTFLWREGRKAKWCSSDQDQSDTRQASV
jgi:hypothetical protein